MDNLLGFIGSILKDFLFDIVFFWFGWAIIKIGTLGRYPRTIIPGKAGCADHRLVAVFGLLSFVGIIAFLAYLQN
jgi:hypothetical protein